MLPIKVGESVMCALICFHTCLVWTALVWTNLPSLRSHRTTNKTNHLPQRLFSNVFIFTLGYKKKITIYLQRRSEKAQCRQVARPPQLLRWRRCYLQRQLNSADVVMTSQRIRYQCNFFYNMLQAFYVVLGYNSIVSF